MTNVKRIAAFLLIGVSSMMLLLAGCSIQDKAHEDGYIGMYDLDYTLHFDENAPKEVQAAWDHNHAVSALQGIVNKTAPNLYVFFIKNKDVDIDRYWWDKYRAKGEWLAGKDTIVYHDIASLFEAYKSSLKGAVVYDPQVPATSNIASSIAGIDSLIPVRYDTTAGSLYHKLVLNGPRLPVKKWLLQEDGTPLFTGEGMISGTSRSSSGSRKNDAYIWFLEHYMKKGLINTEYGAYYIDQKWMEKPDGANRNHHALSNHDFFISRRAFFFDLSPWGDEAATDEPDQKPGTDLQTLKEYLLTAYQQNDHGKTFSHIGGFPPWAFKYTKHAGGSHEDVPTEWEYSEIISAYNAFKDADAINFGALANASFWQHFPLKESYPQDWVTPQELEEEGYLTADGKLNLADRNFIVFYVGDYDASSWLSQTTPTLWDSPDRGKVPLMWSISPILARRVPMAMHYRWESATANDYFAAADNGAGYLMPGVLQEPRPISGLPDGLDAWAAHNKPFYKQWGLSITGFIIDGHAPGLNQDGLDAYATFSPNGIVPQKTPLSSLHGNMPVIRADDDVNAGDPAKAAQHILRRVKDRPIPFHWFRNILKDPSWYVQVVAELKKLDPNIELLEAPKFFELYRIYLKEQAE